MAVNNFRQLYPHKWHDWHEWHDFLLPPRQIQTKKWKKSASCLVWSHATHASHATSLFIRILWFGGLDLESAEFLLIVRIDYAAIACSAITTIKVILNFLYPIPSTATTNQPTKHIKFC